MAYKYKPSGKAYIVNPRNAEPVTWVDDGQHEDERPTWCNLLPGQGCQECDHPRGGPLHFGGSNCRSKGMGAKEGFRAHCSCDGCY